MVYDKETNGNLFRYHVRNAGQKGNCDELCKDVLQIEADGKYTIIYFHCYVTESENNENLYSPIGMSFSKRDIQCSIQRTIRIC